MILALCMASLALPLNQQESNVIEDREERSIAFRPLFAYKEEQAHNHHPVQRRHIIVPNAIDNIPYNSYYQNANPSAYPFYQYPI